jgi:hypothetical protein
VARKPAIHTLPADAGGWINRREGSSRALGRYDRKVDAQAAGREAARRDHTEHVVHNSDGRIATRNSYGNDPRSRPG